MFFLQVFGTSKGKLNILSQQQSNQRSILDSTTLSHLSSSSSQFSTLKHSKWLLGDGNIQELDDDEVGEGGDQNFDSEDEEEDDKIVVGPLSLKNEEYQKSHLSHLILENRRMKLQRLQQKLKNRFLSSGGELVDQNQNDDENGEIGIFHVHDMKQINLQFFFLLFVFDVILIIILLFFRDDEEDFSMVDNSSSNKKKRRRQGRKLKRFEDLLKKFNYPV